MFSYLSFYAEIFNNPGGILEKRGAVRPLPQAGRITLCAGQAVFVLAVLPAKRRGTFYAQTKYSIRAPAAPPVCVQC